MRLSIAVPFVLLLVASLVATGCDGVTPFERRSIDPESETFRPIAPDSLQLEVNDRTARMVWKDESTNEDGFLVERAVDDTTQYEVIARLPPNSSTYTDDFEGDGFRVFYRVSPFVERDGEIRQRPVRASSPLFNFEKQEPTLTIQSERAFRIEWSDPYASEENYVIERRGYPDTVRDDSAKGSFEQIAVVPKDQTSYVDSSAFQVRNEYEYQIRAVRGEMTGPWTRATRVRLYVSPPGPLRLSDDGQNDAEALLTWDDVSSDVVAGFILEQRKDGAPWTRIATKEPDAQQHLLTELDTSSTYSFRLRTLSSRFSEVVRMRHEQGIQREGSPSSGTSSTISVVEFGPSGDIVYSAYGDRIRVQEWRTEERLLSGFFGADVTGLHVLPSREQFLVSTGTTFSSRGGIYLYITKSGDDSRGLVGPGQPTIIASADDSKMVYFDQELIRVADTETGDVMQDFDPGATGGNYDGAFHPTEPLLLVASRDRKVRVYDLEKNQNVGTASFSSLPRRLRYTASGDRLFAIQDNRLKALDPLTGELLGEVGNWEEDVRSYALLDGDRIAVTWGEAGKSGIDVITVDGTRLQRRISMDFGIRTSVGARGSYFVTGSSRGKLDVWTLDTRWGVY